MIFSKQQLAVRSVIIALLIGFVFIVIDSQYPQVTTKIRSVVHAAMSPIYSFAEQTRFTKEKASVTLTSKTQLERENKALKAKLAQANIYLQKYASLSAENAHLRGMLAYPTPVDGRVEIASVIGIDNNPLRQIVVINRGKKHGVYVGQTLLDESGIMGQVINVYGSSSRAMLLSDGDHSIAVKVARTGVRAVVTGNGDNGALDLNYVPNTADLQVGDKIVTSGLGQRFPSGYAVGVVSNIDRVNKQEFIRAKIKPSAKLTEDNYVMLLFPNKKIQLDLPPVIDETLLDADPSSQILLEADAKADHKSNTENNTAEKAKKSSANTATQTTVTPNASNQAVSENNTTTKPESKPNNG